MTSSIVDPRRSQAVRLSATRSLLALDRLRLGGGVGIDEVDALRSFSADLDEIARWEGWIREEALLSSALGTSAAADRLRDVVAFDAVEFTADDVTELSQTANKLAALAADPSRGDASSIDAIENVCTKLIRKLAPQASLDIALTAPDLTRA